MGIYRIIDSKTGLFIRDDFVANDGEVGLDVPPAQGFYWPKWDGKAWVEGRTQAAIDAIKAQAVADTPPSLEDRLALLESENAELKARLKKVEAVPLVKDAIKPMEEIKR